MDEIREQLQQLSPPPSPSATSLNSAPRNIVLINDKSGADLAYTVITVAIVMLLLYFLLRPPDFIRYANNNHTRRNTHNNRQRRFMNRSL